MSESGGTTTQSGIYYQNSIAALFLGRLVDPTRDSSKSIESVRVEAPESVDDIVVRYSNGNTEYIQAKESLDPSSDAWKKLWMSFSDQAAKCQKDGKSYGLSLVISNTSNILQSLRELCNRANGKVNVDEWKESLNANHDRIVAKIESCIKIKDDNSIFTLLKTVEVKVIPLDDIDSDYCPNWIPASNVSKTILFSHFRDMVGGFARIRRIFNSSKLLGELLSRYEITIPDSPHWGIDIYRESIRNEFHLLTVPGTGLSGPIDELFMWPELYESMSSEYQDFEVEDLSAWREVKTKSVYDLKNFPDEEISQAVINATAGLGKTTLLKAIAYQLTKNPIIVTAFISLSALTDSTSVINFLNKKTNEEYQVNIDWDYMSSAGRVTVFFDGLDELSDTERQNVLNKIAKYVARYPKTSYLLTVRDSSILTNQLDAKLLEIRRLTDDKIIEFTKAYSRFGATFDSEVIIEHTKLHPDLAHLLRIPLFLALVLATYKPTEYMPSSRAQILERYLEILLTPEKYKPSQEKNENEYLREVTESLAYTGLSKDHIGFTKTDVLRHLRGLKFCEKPSGYLESLIKFGILTSNSSRIQFTYPTVQEYLAAQYMIENNEDELINGFDKIIHRPWAQAMQFALESYASSDVIIKKQLLKPDDSFFTSLRLIARSVVNGCKVDKKTKKYLGELLSDAWTTDSTPISNSIGYLLLDGYTSSLPDKAEEFIIKGWALNYGGAKILTAKKDNKLTEKVLVSFLSMNLEYRYHLHDWQEAVDEIAEKALDLYIERALDENTNENEIEPLRSLIVNLNDKNIPQLKWKGVVEEKSLHPIIRLVAAMKIPLLVKEEIQQLYVILKEKWIESEYDYSLSHTFTKLFWNMPECELLNLVEERALTDERLENLIESFFRQDKQSETNLDLLFKIYSSGLLSDDLKFKLNILLSSRSEFTDEVYAAEQLKVQNIKNINRWCFLLGHLDRETSLIGLNHLISRSFNKKDFMIILSSLGAGLNYVMEPTLSNSGVLDKKQYHSATPDFSNWLVEQFPKYEFDDRELIRVLNWISEVSLGKTEYDIESLMDSIFSTYDPKEEEKDNDRTFDWAISSGFQLCEREKIQLSESCLMRFILLKQHNIMMYALKYLPKVANENTIEKLINIHNDLPGGHRRGMILDALDDLSSRFGIRVINNSDGALRIAVQ